MRNFTTPLLALIVLAIAFPVSAQELLEDHIHSLYGEQRAKSRVAFQALTRIAEDKNDANSAAASSAIKEYAIRCRRVLSQIGNDSDISASSLEVRLHTDQKISESELRCTFFVQQPIRVGIYGRHLDDTCLRVFEDVSQIAILDAESSGITGATLKHLSTDQLISLRFRKCPVEDSGFMGIEFPQLNRLDVSYSKVTNQLLEGLRAPKLAWLHIEGSSIDGDGFVQLRRFEKLHVLKVDAEQLSEASISRLAKAAPQLRVLSVACRNADLKKVESFRTLLPNDCKLEVKEAMANSNSEVNEEGR